MSVRPSIDAGRQEHRLGIRRFHSSAMGSLQRRMHSHAGGTFRLCHERSIDAGRHKRRLGIRRFHGSAMGSFQRRVHSHAGGTFRLCHERSVDAGRQERRLGCLELRLENLVVRGRWTGRLRTPRHPVEISAGSASLNQRLASSLARKYGRENT